MKSLGVFYGSTTFWADVNKYRLKDDSAVSIAMTEKIIMYSRICFSVE